MDLLMFMWLPFIVILATSGPLQSKPNIIIFFIDDMGYSDIEPFGGNIDTPNLNRLAQEGKILTDFLVSAPICSSSRASLLTGCFNVRVGVNGAYFPDSRNGLNPDEITIAEICKSMGYATACFGKWHLGHQPKFMPLEQGFDEYFGIPYSNDMWPPNLIPGHKPFPPLPLFEGYEVVVEDMTSEDQAKLTKQITDKSVDFINRHTDQSFFLYIPHPMVHVPLYTSKQFTNKSGMGKYADVVMELDWSVGEVVKALEKNGLVEETLILFTSDNGPSLIYGSHGGSANPLREGKLTIFEGGIRVPTVVWWPGFVPAGTSTDTMLSTIDILPTVASLIGAEFPKKTIDGYDIIEHLFSTEEIRSPHKAYPLYHYREGSLLGIRNERFKLVFPHEFKSLGSNQPSKDGVRGTMRSVRAAYSLFDLESDIAETKNVSHQYPGVVSFLEESAQIYRNKFGDQFTGMVGNEVRPEGVLSSGDSVYLQHTNTTL